MANRNTPTSSTHKGWFFDTVNNRLEIYYNGTKVGHVNASGLTITNDTTTYMSNSVLQSAGLGNNAVSTANIASGARQYYVRAAAAALASNGANAVISQPVSYTHLTLPTNREV